MPSSFICKLNPRDFPRPLFMSGLPAVYLLDLGNQTSYSTKNQSWWGQFRSRSCLTLSFSTCVRWLQFLPWEWNLKYFHASFSFLFHDNQPCNFMSHRLAGVLASSCAAAVQNSSKPKTGRYTRVCTWGLTQSWFSSTKRKGQQSWHSGKRRAQLLWYTEGRSHSLLPRLWHHNTKHKAIWNALLCFFLDVFRFLESLKVQFLAF